MGETPMMAIDGQEPLVFVVDDDEQVLRPLIRILRKAGYRVEAYSSPRDFLDRAKVEPPCCLLLDVQMPEITGLDLQAIFAKGEVPPAIVFMSGVADVPTSVRAMKAGAFDFLPKPFVREQLLEAVAGAMEKNRERAAAHAQVIAARARLARLTPRERQVCEGLARGLRSKEIAQELGAAEKTVNIHRSRVMSKLAVRSVADLVRLVARAAGESPGGGATPSPVPPAAPGGVEAGGAVDDAAAMDDAAAEGGAEDGPTR